MCIYSIYMKYVCKHDYSLTFSSKNNLFSSHASLDSSDPLYPVGYRYLPKKLLQKTLYK